ncbi:PT repeat family protein, putative [Babesia ovis]|uniref:PT repeat family protein, putative n=1 Tax=Babesia ovis TaxID=5869 RepID=A0A9W5WU64_BABOV|nr:PT repeat family protein, putative [Babesia ovis]
MQGGYTYYAQADVKTVPQSQTVVQVDPRYHAPAVVQAVEEPTMPKVRRRMVNASTAIIQPGKVVGSTILPKRIPLLPMLPYPNVHFVGRPAEEPTEDQTSSDEATTTTTKKTTSTAKDSKASTKRTTKSKAKTTREKSTQKSTKKATPPSSEASEPESVGVQPIPAVRYIATNIPYATVVNPVAWPTKVVDASGYPAVQVPVEVQGIKRRRTPTTGNWVYVKNPPTYTAINTHTMESVPTHIAQDSNGTKYLVAQTQVVQPVTSQVVEPVAPPVVQQVPQPVVQQVTPQVVQPVAPQVVQPVAPPMMQQVAPQVGTMMMPSGRIQAVPVRTVSAPPQVTQLRQMPPPKPQLATGRIVSRTGGMNIKEPILVRKSPTMQPMTQYMQQPVVVMDGSMMLGHNQSPVYMTPNGNNMPMHPSPMGTMPMTAPMGVDYHNGTKDNSMMPYTTTAEQTTISTDGYDMDYYVTPRPGNPMGVTDEVPDLHNAHMMNDQRMSVPGEDGSEHGLISARHMMYANGGMPDGKRRRTDECYMDTQVPYDTFAANRQGIPMYGTKMMYPTDYNAQYGAQQLYASRCVSADNSQSTASTFIYDRQMSDPNRGLVDFGMSQATLKEGEVDPKDFVDAVRYMEMNDRGHSATRCNSGAPSEVDDRTIYE